MLVRLLPSATSATSLRVSALAGPDPIGMDLGDFSMAAGKEPTTTYSRLTTIGKSTRERSTRERGARKEKGALERIPWKGRRQGRAGRGASSENRERSAVSESSSVVPESSSVVEERSAVEERRSARGDERSAQGEERSGRSSSGRGGALGQDELQLER
jgi:hypothetical protein